MDFKLACVWTHKCMWKEGVFMFYVLSSHSVNQRFQSFYKCSISHQKYFLLWDPKALPYWDLLKSIHHVLARPHAHEEGIKDASCQISRPPRAYSAGALLWAWVFYLNLMGEHNHFMEKTYFSTQSWRPQWNICHFHILSAAHRWKHNVLDNLPLFLIGNSQMPDRNGKA